jgi:hypothetical protein
MTITFVHVAPIREVIPLCLLCDAGFERALDRVACEVIGTIVVARIEKGLSFSEPDAR